MNTKPSHLTINTETELAAYREKIKQGVLLENQGRDCEVLFSVKDNKLNYVVVWTDGRGNEGVVM